jgi:hypothetical protein
MYFQTGQVIFVPEWPKGEFVSILASFCVWTKSLMCKDAINRDSTCQSIFRRLYTAKKIEDFSFLVSRPDDVSSRPDTHLSTVTYVRTTCSSRPDAKQTSIIRLDDISFPFGPYTVSRSFCSSLHPSGHLSSPSGRISVLEQSQILSKFQKKEDRSTVRTMWYPVRTCVSLRQELQFKYHRPDVIQPWSGCALIC